jgi:serine/threonine protein kinase/tetratricopeptide (TPR) repeat protein
MAMSKADEEVIFHTARRIMSPEDRRLYVEQACGADRHLQARVEALLHVHDEEQSFLKSPAEGFRDGVEDRVREGPGTEIGPYRLREPLGEGGMGTVFRAEQAQPVRRQVALKIIKPGLDSGPVLARFEAERQALALMDHPHIAKVLDAGETPPAYAGGSPRLYFVMELVPGVPITQYCDEKRLTLRQRLELFVHVCQGVQHAHQKGIIHRDLKPANVLVALYNGRPVPKIIDFGVAKATGLKLTERTLVTEFGAVIGTPDYMSPEQAVPNQLDIDTRSDIYSLGVLLYELLTDTTPLHREQSPEGGFLELLRRIRDEEPPRPSERLSGSDTLPRLAADRQTEPKKLIGQVRGDLDWIVMKCLDKDRNRRYETANALALDVERYLRDEPVLAGPPGAGYRLRKFLRRHQGPVLAAGLVLVALVGGMLGTTWGLIRAMAAEKEAQGNATTALVNEETARREAAIAQALNDFLQKDLLGQADIGNQPLLGGVERNRHIEVGELLGRAAKAIEGKFPDQPLTEAAIRLTLGETYRGLARYAEAQPHLERSIQLRTTQLGADHLDTLNAKHHLAVLYYGQGKYDRAEPLLQEVLAAHTAQLGADHQSLLGAKSNLAALYYGQGKYNRAEPLLQEVLQARTLRLGADHSDTLISKNNLALLYLHQGKYDRAEPLFQQVIQARTAQLGTDHPDILSSKNDLVMLYHRQKKYDRAELLCQEVLQVQTAKLGAEHLSTLSSKNSLAVLLYQQGKYDRAELLYQEVIQALTAQLGADHPNSLSTKYNLAMLYRDQGKYDRAEPLLREVLQAQTAKLGVDHPDTLVSKHNLAVLYRDQGKYDRAEPLFREAVEGARTTLGLTHPSTQTFLRNLADCYERMEQPARAEPLWRELAAFLRQHAGADSRDYARELVPLARNLLRQKRVADAERLLREGLAIFEKAEADAWTTFNTRSLLGGALLGQQKYADAEPFLEQGYRGMKEREAQIPQAAQSHLTEALKRLVQLYDDWGKPDQAARWRKRLEEREPNSNP